MVDHMPFELYTVSDSRQPVRCTGGLIVTPDFTFGVAPRPRVVVIPAQGDRSETMLEWLRQSSQSADITMSVCTGAFVLAAAGLLEGKKATTHHQFLDQLSQRYPGVEVKRGLRFVEEEKVSSAGGLTSGIDLALHVVERYFGRKTAQQTADYMEYQSEGWKA